MTARGPARGPAPQCLLETCTAEARWSSASRRWLKYCSPEHAAPGSRGTCRGGRHPFPGPGERCKFCKADRQRKDRGQPQGPSTADTGAARRSRPAESTQPRPAPPSDHRAQDRPAWRPAGMDRWAARCGPGDPTVAPTGE